MSKPTFKHGWLPTGTALIGLAVLALSSATAATSGAGSAKARYLRDIAHCRTLTGDPRANCLSEASTAYAQTQPTPPQENPMQLAQNALRRCDRVPEPDHSDCVARINGAGMADGSVAGGGILYKLVTRETAPVAQASPTTGTASPGMSATPAPVVPESLPPTGAGPTPAAKPATPPIEPAPADVPPAPPVPPQPPHSPGAVNPPGSGS